MHKVCGARCPRACYAPFLAGKDGLGSHTDKSRVCMFHVSCFLFPSQCTRRSGASSSPTMSSRWVTGFQARVASGDVCWHPEARDVCRRSPRTRCHLGGDQVCCRILKRMFVRCLGPVGLFGGSDACRMSFVACALCPVASSRREKFFLKKMTPLCCGSSNLWRPRRRCPRAASD